MFIALELYHEKNFETRYLVHNIDMLHVENNLV